MLPERLKIARKQRKITQDEVAQFLQVKRQTYSAYERGVSVPDSLTLKKLADYFDVSTDFFFGDISKSRSMQEEKLMLMSRRMERIPESARERILKNFEDNIDMYLEAMAGKEKSDA